MENSTVIKLDESNFDREVTRHDKPVVVDFWAEWCGPCKMIAPVLDEIAREKAGLNRMSALLGNTPLKVVLFDLDGTLLDTGPEFYAIVTQMLNNRGLTALDYDDFRECVSDGARGMVKKAFAIAETDPQFEPLRQEFLTLYAEQLAARTELFAGMADVLDFIESTIL